MLTGLIQWLRVLLMAKPKTPTGDVNSELQLIDLLKTVLSDLRGVRDELSELKASIHINDDKQQERHRQIMTALETLTESIRLNTEGQATLTTAVNAAIVRLGTPGATDAQLLSLASAVDSSTASDAALTAALNAALTPTPTP